MGLFLIRPLGGLNLGGFLFYFCLKERGPKRGLGFCFVTPNLLGKYSEKGGKNPFFLPPLSVFFFKWGHYSFKPQPQKKPPKIWKKIQKLVEKKLFCKDFFIISLFTIFFFFFLWGLGGPIFEKTKGLKFLLFWGPRKINKKGLSTPKGLLILP